MATKSVDWLNHDLAGGDGDDTLLGDWRDNFIRGNGGKDEIIADGGVDTVFGDAGDDRLFGQSGDDNLFGGLDNDYIHGGDDNDDIFGGSGNDELRGGRGDDEIFGDGGDDLIIDLEGVDRIDGGANNDTITVWGGDGFRFDTVSGGSGNDEISAAKSKVLVSAGSGDDVIHTDLHANKVLSGGAGNDRFVIDSLSTSAGRIVDILGHEGTVARSTNIFGVESITSVTPSAGINDTGIDTLDLSNIQGTSESIFDVPDAGSVDKLFVDLTSGLMSRVEGSVGLGNAVPSEFQVARLNGIENVVGSNGGDSIVGNAAANDLRGLNGEDFIDGSSGNDTIDGGALDDKLKGGAGADTILGGSGDDVIEGDGAGIAVSADTLTGGAGADRFVFTDVGKGVAGVQPGGIGVPVGTDPIRDRITDFDISGSDHDLIDLSALLDNRSTFTGSTVQEAFSQGYIFLVQGSRGTVVKVDLNGGTHTDTANVFDVAHLDGVSFSLTTLAVVRDELFLV